MVASRYKVPCSTREILTFHLQLNIFGWGHSLVRSEVAAEDILSCPSSSGTILHSGSTLNTRLTQSVTAHIVRLSPPPCPPRGSRFCEARFCTYLAKPSFFLVCGAPVHLYQAFACLLPLFSAGLSNQRDLQVIRLFLLQDKPLPLLLITDVH